MSRIDTGRKDARGDDAPGCVARQMRVLSSALLSLALACGDGGTGPSAPTIGPIGPFPQGMTGKVAFVVSRVVTSSAEAHTESQVHVIDVANPTDRVIYTAPPNVSIQGLTWSPDAQRVVAQTFLSRVDSDGNNRSIWQLHSVNVASTQEVILFPSSAPQYHPAYSSTGRLAYFAGWSDDPAAGIFVDGQPKHAVASEGSSYLSWTPDESTIIYSRQGLGLQELTLQSGSVRQLVAPEAEEVIQQPAVSPDGTTIAMLRFGGTRHGQEIWTLTAAGDGAQRLTDGFGDEFPGWTPNGAYVAFVRSGPAQPGIYVIPASGGTPTRVVGISEPALGPMSWSP
jgi:Tol biopolymer transport system component